MDGGTGSRAGAAGAALIVVALALAGCGEGSSEAPGASSGGDAPTGGFGGGTGGSIAGGVATGAAPSSGGDPATGGTSGSGGDATSGAITEEEFPARLAAVGCAVWSGCCAGTSFPHDEATCVESVTRRYTTRVNDPLAVFDAARASACLGAFEHALEGCLAPYFWDGVVPCPQVFTGTLPEGAECEEYYRCAAPLGGTSTCYGEISWDVQTCYQYTSAELGEGCTGSFDCVEGLYCTSDRSARSGRPMGRRAAATAASASASVSTGVACRRKPPGLRS